MKKLLIVIISALLLTGCAATPTFEPVTDVYAQDAPAEPRSVSLKLPTEAAAQVISGDNGTIYLCDGYEVIRQVLPAGDLSATLRSLTGYERDKLSVIETGAGELVRYSCVWTAAGETGDIIARATVLDDGEYHYCLTVMTNADDVGKYQAQWQEIFASYSLG